MSTVPPLPSVTLASPESQAAVFLNGAHVTSWKPAGQRDVLFMSKASHFAAGKAIRGGVPIIFPWFGGRDGHPESPAHGYARTMAWQILGVEKRPDGSFAMNFELLSNAATLDIWPYEFALRFTVVSDKKLSMTLAVTNTGAKAFQFEEALHTYLAIGDIKHASITGLTGSTYIDKVDGFKKKPQGPEPIVITGETDRVYLNTQSTCVVNDPVWNRKLIVEKQNSNATVVWNPWIAKAKAMSDFGDDEWPGMVCVETANVGEHAVNLEPGKTHAMTAAVSVG